MDHIKTRQQKYKKGKERMLSLTQSVDAQGNQVTQEDDDDEGISTYSMEYMSDACNC